MSPPAVGQVAGHRRGARRRRTRAADEREHLVPAVAEPAADLAAQEAARAGDEDAAQVGLRQVPLAAGAGERQAVAVAARGDLEDGAGPPRCPGMSMTPTRATISGLVARGGARRTPRGRAASSAPRSQPLSAA